MLAHLAALCNNGTAVFPVQVFLLVLDSIRAVCCSVLLLGSVLLLATCNFSPYTDTFFHMCCHDFGG